MATAISTWSRADVTFFAQERTGIVDNGKLDVETAEALGIPRTEIERVAGHSCPPKTMAPANPPMPQDNPHY